MRCDAVMPPGRSRSLLLLVCQEPERTQPDVHFFQGLRLGVSAPGSGPRPGLCWDRVFLEPGRTCAESGAGPGRERGPGMGATLKEAGSGPAEGAGLESNCGGEWGLRTVWTGSGQKVKAEWRWKGLAVCGQNVGKGLRGSQTRTRASAVEGRRGNAGTGPPGLGAWPG